LPSGIHFEPSGSDQRYQTLINRFFNDVGGSSIYQILTQYPDSMSGPPANSVGFGGSVVDTNAYPHAGTASDPLTDQDLQAEIDKIRMEQHWPEGLTNHYFIFTGDQILSCMDPDHKSCSLTEGGYCGYHSHFDVQSGPVIYSVMPTAAPGCLTTGGPNGDDVADSEISTASHELFEAASDPLGNAWYDLGGSEIGDKCNQVFGALDSSGGNVTVNGHEYRVQLEWSNATASCERGVPLDRGTIQIANVACNTSGTDLPACQLNAGACSSSCQMNFDGATITCTANNVCTGTGTGSIGGKKFDFSVTKGGTIADSPCQSAHCDPGGIATLDGTANYGGKSVSFGLRVSGNGGGARLDSFTVDLGNENYAWRCRTCVQTSEVAPPQQTSTPSSQSSSSESSSSQTSSSSSSSSQTSSAP
jgi:hypothetical protein